MSQYPPLGSAIAIGLILGVVLIAAIIASGQTFGQRCAKAFPDDPVRAELCVYNLSKGNAP